MPSANGDELVFEVPAEPEAIALARLFAAASCRHLGIDEERIDDVKVAVSEAVTNAIKAHRATAVPERITLIMRLADPSMEIVDRGGGIQPDHADAGATPPAGLYEGSLGLTLINALFPDARIASNTFGGTTVRLPLDGIASAAAGR